jgi:hypothetical protein
MAEGYNSGMSEGCKQELDRLLREEIRLLKEEIKLLQQLLPKYYPAIGITITQN